VRTTNRADPVMARLSGTYVRRSGLSQRQIVVPLISATRPWAKTARRSAVRDQRDNGTPARVGSSHASLAHSHFVTEGIRAVPLACMLTEAPAEIRGAVGLRIGRAGTGGRAGLGRGGDRSDARRRSGPEGSREAAGRAA